MNSPVVLITGALTGIGRATALAFADDRARVVISGRDETAGARFAAELLERGAETEFVRADVRREDDMQSLVDAAIDRFGRLDVAVSDTAGRAIAARAGERLVSCTLDTYCAMNYASPFGRLKASGIGRQNGIEAINQYLQTTSVWCELGETIADPFIMKV